MNVKNVLLLFGINTFVVRSVFHCGDLKLHAFELKETGVNIFLDILTNQGDILKT